MSRQIQPGHQQCAGFTLIELLVVLVILALFSGMVIISIGDNFVRKMEAEAERLKSIVIASSDEALYSGRELGIHFSSTEYQILRWDNLARSWILVAKQPFQLHRLPEGMRMELSVDGFVPPQDDEDQGAVDISFGPQEDSLFGSEGGDQEVAPDAAEEGEAVDLTPQLLTLSSGEVSVFDVTFYADQSLSNRSRIRVFSDGFSLPRIKNISSQEAAEQ